MRKRWIALLVVLAGTAGCRPSSAGFSAQDDRAKLFTAETTAEVDLQVREIKTRYHKDLRIQTFPKVSRGRDWLGKFKTLDEPAQQKFFAEWAHDRARSVDGVYLLVCQEPLHVQVEVSRSTRKYFEEPAAKELRDRLLSALREDRADAGIKGAAEFVDQQLNDKLGPVPVPEPYDWVAMTLIILALLGTWIVLEGVRRVSASAGPSGPEYFAGVSPLGHGLASDMAVLANPAGSRPPASSSHVADEHGQTPAPEAAETITRGPSDEQA